MRAEFSIRPLLFPWRSRVACAVLALVFLWAPASLSRPGQEPEREDSPTRRPRPDDSDFESEPRLPRPGQPLPPSRPGVISRREGRLPSGFDPARLGEREDERAAKRAEDERSIDEMIVFTSNYEKGVRCRKMPLSARVSMDFEDAELIDLLKFIGCITEKNFIVGRALAKGRKITIMSPEEVSAYEAYKVFLVALEMNGLTVVPAGKYLKVVEMKAAAQDTIPLLGPGDTVPDIARLVTRIVQLEHIDGSEIQQVLDKFKTQHGDITVYAPNNTLFVTDLASNIRRLLRLVEELDVAVGRERVWVRKIEYAEAAQLIDKLQGVFGDGGAAPAQPARRTTPRPTPRGRRPTPQQEQPTTVGEPSEVQVSKILADERTNQLLIVATPSSYFKVDRLIRKLDVPIPGEGAIHVHYLENADAEEVAQTLSNLVGGTGAAQQQRTQAQTARQRAAARREGDAGAGTAALFEGEVQITAHKPNNALIVQATLKDYESVRRVIQKLDTRRRQVYVEAVIMEVSSSKDRKFGVSGSGGTTFDIGGETVPMLFGMGGLGISALDTQQLTRGGMAVGMQGPLLDVSAGSGTGTEGLTGTLSIPSFGFLLQAIQSNSDVNILSTPHILTVDNEEAEIQVGKQIPYQAQTLGGLGSLGALGGLTGGLTGTTRTAPNLGALGGLGTMGALGGLGGFGAVQRIDVDMTLRITPHINESNYVRLETELQIDDVESIDQTLGPTTSKRRVTNTVVVRDQQPVVIGGLIRDSESQAVDKVPFLGDLPLLGIAFRRTTTRIEKRNLLLVLVPYIVDDPAVDLKRIHKQKMEEMRRFSEYMATRHKEYEGDLDYAKKHGALEAMRQTLAEVRKEREQMERVLFEDSELDTVGPPETHDIEWDPYDEAERLPSRRGLRKPRDEGYRDDERPRRPGARSPKGDSEGLEPIPEPLL